MTLPRQVVPDRDYMITRRCSERRFFLRPDKDTNNAFLYCLILAAKRAKVDVTFSVAMSNHHHTGIHDPDGNFPIFTEHFHGLLARCQNAYLGRFEGFWSSEPTSVVHLVEPHDILDKMTYAFTNPAAADLVDSVEEWPGVATFQATITGGHLTATRPRHFFRGDGDMPDVVSLRITRPHGFQELEQSEWASLVTERVRAAEAEHRQSPRRPGNHRARTSSSPCAEAIHVSSEPLPAVPDEPSRGRQEQMGTHRGAAPQSRVHRQVPRRPSGPLGRLGRHLFPFGTYWMRKFAKVICETAEISGDVASARAMLAAPT